MIIKGIFNSIILSIASLVISFSATAQNSLLVNFGSDSCTANGSPIFSLIKDPFGTAPSPLTVCSLTSQLSGLGSVFVAYNPKNNKIYIASIADGADTKIWTFDMGLPSNITCPSVNDSMPDYTYNYVSNNFEFDNDGNLWSLSNYVDTLGQCNIDNLDATTGNIINTRTVQFPAENFPSTISSGDITILPNGRMFAVLGIPSKLYEITNYSSTSSNATATFLDSIPQSCFGMAYINGQLELSGSDFSGNCYYYKYNIANEALSYAQPFQAGQLPVDNTSISPSLGVTKQLLNAQKINDNTANLTYEIYVRNLGNAALNNINVSDNLATVFGAANVSGISVAFEPNANAENLQLNPSYNGIDDTSLLIAGQNLNNQTSTNTNYFFTLTVNLTATNLNNNNIYLNSAIGNATIGNAGSLNFINVSDSSNNGPQSAVDPNNDGNAGEPGENVPTPFSFLTLPVKFININASFVNAGSAMVTWIVAQPLVNADKFLVEFSSDGINFYSIGGLNVTDPNQSKYEFLQNNISSGNLFYRIKEIDKDGKYVYSRIVVLTNKNASAITIFPNPANNYIYINEPSFSPAATQIFLYDITGKILFDKTISSTTTQVETNALPNGTYILKVLNNETITTQKLLILHK